MQSYTVREWEKLSYGEGKREIPEPLADQLATVASRCFTGKGGSRVLEHGREALRAKNVVGMLVAPDCRLEILPKIDVGTDGTPEGPNAAIRQRLVHMLAVVHKLDIDPGAVTQLDWQHKTLLEILIGLFCDKLTEAVRKGMPRRYIEKEDDLAALRGKLNVVRQFTRHAANPSRLACRFDVLSEDTPLNRIMKATVAHLFRLSRSWENQKCLHELAFVYAEIPTVPPSTLRWDKVAIDRTNRWWQELLDMARLFLSNRYQTTTGGPGQGTALLFEMPALFEEYVGRQVRRALAGTDLTARLQGGRLHCLTTVSTPGKPCFETKPDILIERAGKVTHVIDTKWKRISSEKGEAEQGVSPSDVYQMMAYAQVYHQAPRLTLLYPHHAGWGEREGIHARYRINGQENAILETASFDVANGNDVHARIRERLLHPAEVTK